MSAIILVAYVAFMARRLLTYLHVFQQDEYDGPRFLRWIASNLAIDRRASGALLAVGTMEMIGLAPSVVAMAIGSAVMLGLAYLEKDPRLTGKKRLSMTSRAKRIYGVAFLLLALGASMIPFWLTAAFVYAGVIFFIQMIPLALVAANAILSPYERAIQRRYWTEAYTKIRSLNPTVIGITGSYGKTSVKGILSHILGAYAPTLSTPGSVNTPMGVSRIIREQLAPHHTFFICELGAYGKGSIERLCRLAPPHLGVITSIGWAHYERFKTIENVAEAKLELASSVGKCQGKMIVPENISPWVDKFMGHRERPEIVLVGATPGCSLVLVDSRQELSGVQLDVVWQGTPYALKAPLFGQHQVNNLALAFAAACSLGMNPEDVATAMLSVPQIKHRLEVQHTSAGYILIDNAYNSNPVGFANGLQLLGLFHRAGGRRILVTPGMVELGTAHDQLHRDVGEVAAKYVDVLLAIRPERIESLIAAYARQNPGGAIIRCATLADAQVWLKDNVGPDDVVLLENDLPDLYERTLRL